MEGIVYGVVAAFAGVMLFHWWRVLVEEHTSSPPQPSAPRRLPESIAAVAVIAGSLLTIAGWSRAAWAGLTGGIPWGAGAHDVWIPTLGIAALLSLVPHRKVEVVARLVAAVVAMALVRLPETYFDASFRFARESAEDWSFWGHLLWLGTLFVVFSRASTMLWLTIGAIGLCHIELGATLFSHQHAPNPPDYYLAQAGRYALVSGLVAVLAVGWWRIFVEETRRPTSHRK